MSIRKWHYGKLIIVWAWGGGIAALVLINFQTSPVEVSPWRHLLELMFVFAVAVGLTVVTWKWLGDRAVDGGSAVRNDRS